MALSDKTIFLASRSPRRRDLLRQIGVGHELLLLRDDARRGIDVDETPKASELPADYVRRIALAKARAGIYSISRRAGFPKPLLAADTTVAVEDQIIGKPSDADHAAEILAQLSGRSHRVITAVAVAHGDRVESRVSESVVWMRDIGADEIRRYVASGEPLDKAGAYAIQGRAAAFITRIEGSYTGIVGLPLAETVELLRLFGIEAL